MAGCGIYVNDRTWTYHKRTMMSRRICMICQSLNVGGIERAMSTLANYFVTRDCEVYFLTIYSYPKIFKLDNRITLYENPNLYSKKGIVGFYLKTFGPIKGWLPHKVDEIHPDVVMSFGDYMPHMAMISLKGKYPFYYANRSNPMISYSLPFEWIRSYAYKYYPPAGIIAQTQLAKKRKEKIFGDKLPRIVVIPNPARQVKHDGEERKNQIISVGRVWWSKGFGRVIDAFAKLKAPDWQLVLVGDGPAMNEMKEYVAGKGIAERVVFTGKTNNVDHFLREAKIYAMGSYKEGFPNALCEGMAAGLAPVSFDIIAGPSDIIDSGKNGFLVKDDDIDAMAERIQYLIDNPIELERIASEASKITAKFSLEKIGNRYYNFIWGIDNE